MKTFAFLLIYVLSIHALAGKNIIVDEGFENQSPGVYNSEMLAADWGNFKWEGLHGRTTIVIDDNIDRNKVLEVCYPEGSVGPNEGGAQFVIPIPPADEYWLSYEFKMSGNYDFRLGGKLPGLTSGGAQYTGGHKPDQGQGWSARYMWREGGKMVLYLYSIDMKGKWGDDHEFNMPAIDPGRWYHVTQHIRVNSGDKTNGLIEVWVDGEPVLHLESLRLRLGDLGKIDTFFFSTFFGGNTSEWGPHHPCKTYFDNFRVWQE